MGLPEFVYIGRHKYWYHSSDTNWWRTKKKIDYYKREFGSKFHIIKTDSFWTAQKMYHLYLTKVKKIL